MRHAVLPLLLLAAAAPAALAHGGGYAPPPGGGGTRIDAYYYCPHHPDGKVERHGRNIEAIGAAYADAPGMCLDIVAYPAGFEANVLAPSLISGRV